MLREDSDHLKAWRAAVQAAAMNAKPPGTIEGPCVLDARFYFKRPAGQYRKDGKLRSATPRFKTSSPDLSKLIRAVEDSLTDARVWTDDRLVVGYAQSGKHWVNIGSCARLVVYEVMDD